MDIISIVVVQDEVDVIKKVLTDTIKKVDKVLIYDSGSVDGTMGEIKILSERNEEIEIINTRPCFYHDTKIRRDAIIKSRSHISDGDWVIWHDADEILAMPPRAFLSNVDQEIEVIKHRHYNFSFTKKQLQNDSYFTSINHFETSKYEYYKEYAYDEVKMFKYFSFEDRYFSGKKPRWEGRCCRHRFPILHYKCRSKPQIKKRLVLRNMIKRWNTNSAGSHWSIQEWEKELHDEDGDQTLLFKPYTVAADIIREDGLADSRKVGKSKRISKAKTLFKNFITSVVGPKTVKKLYPKIFGYIENDGIKYKDKEFNKLLKEKYVDIGLEIST